MAFFSVIIPLYNKENFIENTLKSVLAQDFTDFEVLVVEDHSTDKSYDVVLKIQDPRLKIIQHTENKGLSASRNTGIQNASTDLLCFLDADDLWQTGYLSKLYSLVTNFPKANLFATNYEELYDQKTAVLPASSLKNFTEDGIVADFFDANLYQHIYCCCSICIRRAVFDEIGFYDEKITFGEDVDFNIRANLRYKLAYSKTPLVYVTVFSENQITNSKLNDKTLVDLDKYESLGAENPSLKRYIDVNRYIFSRLFRFENDFENARKWSAKIAPQNVNLKQKILLKLPIPIAKAIRSLKRFFVKSGVRFTSFESF